MPSSHPLLLLLSSGMMNGHHHENNHNHDYDASLLADQQTIETLLTPSYWQSLCPNLHINDSIFLQRASHYLGKDLPVETMRALIDRDGYVIVHGGQLPWGVILEAMAVGVRRLVRHGWDPLFIAGEW